LFPLRRGKGEKKHGRIGSTSVGQLMGARRTWGPLDTKSRALLAGTGEKKLRNSDKTSEGMEAPASEARKLHSEARRGQSWGLTGHQKKLNFEGGRRGKYLKKENETLRP